MIRIMFRQQLDEKCFREHRRITINEVSEVTGLSRPTLSRIANSPGYAASTETIDVLCRYFNCEPGQLLVRVPEEPDGQKRAS